MDKIKTLEDIIENSIKKNSNAVAVRYRYKTTEIEKTYFQLKNDIRELCESIDKMRVGIIGENCYDWLLVFYATIISGGIIVPIAPDLMMEEVQRIIDRFELDILVVGNNYANKIVESSFDNIVRMNCGTVLELKQSINKIKQKGISVKPIKNTCAIYFTSGTTDKSKGVMLGNNQLAANCMALHEALQFAPGRTSLNVLPFHHGFASMCDLIYSFYTGGTLCILGDFRYLNEEMDKYRPQHMFLVPLIAENLLKRIKYEEINSFGPIVKLTSYLECIVCGGAKISQKMVKEYSGTTVKLIRGYGITECSPVVAVMNKNKNYDTETVGTPLSCNEVAIMNGEVCVKGKNVMLGYFSDEKNTKQVLNDGWFKTGDYGMLNDSGDLYILGRKKNIIILDNGENIIPEEIEAVIEEYSEIRECLVFEERKIEKKPEISILIVPEYRKYNDIKSYYNKIYEILEDYNNKMPLRKNISNIYFSEEFFERTSTKKVKRTEVLKHMVKLELELQVKEAIQSILYEKVDINNTMKFIDDLSIDSFEMIRLIGEVEKRLGILLCANKIYDLRCIQQFIDYLFENHLYVDGCTVIWK